TRDKVDCFIDTSIYPGSLESTFRQNLIIKIIGSLEYKIEPIYIWILTISSDIATMSIANINKRLSLSSNIILSNEINAYEIYAGGPIYFCYAKECNIIHRMSMIFA
ncbi:MAG: hypothetical protein JZD41_07555, partial [Thermoproteus sp.]|nr:hypothetical protein [Thermoproteus sp.]